jgi:SAM-dependent MidA family methyltransferase
MNALAEIIRSQIEREGLISFARFMDLALYHPQHGYYETNAQFIGKTGDYFTSVSVGPLFGELLAFQFAEWLEGGQQTLPRTRATIQFVEAGAHDGQLATDILSWLRRHQPTLFGALEYWIVEPSDQRRTWQERRLSEFAPQVRWLQQIPKPNERSDFQSVSGVIFSNELLDALPTHRLGWSAFQQQWFEWGVGVEADRFVWRLMPLGAEAQSAVPWLPEDLTAALPDGFTTEICPGAQEWWRDAGRWLERGRLVTFDYGLRAEEFFLPHRAQGTLRAYHRHHLTTELIAQPGEQDLTGHVNFSALQRAGEAMRLETETFSTQSQFLVQIFERAQKATAEFGEWTRERTRQFQTLTHPDHFGRNFHVLVQRRDEEDNHTAGGGDDSS